MEVEQIFEPEPDEARPNRVLQPGTLVASSHRPHVGVAWL